MRQVRKLFLVLVDAIQLALFQNKFRRVDMFYGGRAVRVALAVYEALNATMTRLAYTVYKVTY
jgi:hypothetical protein